MPAEEKEALLNDLKEYLNPATVRWYAQRGLPYRRGCLFYGPPGTGKTSLSLALAGELKLPLFILSLSTGSLNDEGLTMLFVGLPRRCIVLLEDIDCAGVRDNKNGDTNEDDSEDSSTGSEYDDCSDVSPTRTSHQAATSSRSSKRSGGGGEGSRSGKPLGNADIPGGKESRMPRSSVSFSGLLNAIDGVASQEGRILIMTTNHRERLDPALIRPGRVDIQIELGYAQRETTVEIFRGLYQEMVSEEADEVCRLAGMFADQVPPGQFTPAEIQGFLMSYKGKPVKALENVGAWVKLKTRKETRTTRRTKLRRRPPPIVPPSPPATAPASPTPPVTEATPERERQRLVREVSSIIEKLQHMDSVEGPNPVSESSKSEGRWMHGLEENGHKEELE